MKKIYLFALMLLFAACLCSCQNKNGAHKYNKDNDDSQHTAFVADKKTASYGMNNITACCLSDDNMYYCYKEQETENKVFFARNSSDISELSLDFDYKAITGCIVSDNDIYFLYENEDGKDRIAKTDKTGALIKNIDCDYGSALYTADQSIYLITTNYDNEYIVCEYSKDLEIISSCNVSEQLCGEDELICEVKIDSDNNFCALTAAGVKDTDSDTDNPDLKVVVFRLSPFCVKMQKNLTDSNGVSSVFMTDLSVNVSYRSDKNFCIKELDKSTGECIGESDTFSADAVFDGAYLSDKHLYNFNNDSIFESDDDIICCNDSEYGKIILTMKTTDKIHLCKNSVCDSSADEYIIPVSFKCEPGNKISVNNSIIAINAYDSGSDKNCVVIYNSANNSVNTEYMESYVKDFELTENALIYQQDDKVIRRNFESGENDEEIMSGPGRSSLCQDNHNNVTLLTCLDDEIKVYKYNNNNFDLYDSVDIKTDSESIFTKNGSGDTEFFICSGDEVLEYKKGSVRSIIQISGLNTICDASCFVPLNQDECIICGTDYHSLKTVICDARRIDSTQREIIKVAVGSDIGSDVYEKISEFNNGHKQLAVKTDMTDDIYDLPDIFIYSQNTDVSKYVNNGMFCDLSDLLNEKEDKYLSLAADEKTSGDSIFKAIPSFSFLSCTSSENGLVLGQDDATEKFILAELYKYIDYSAGKCNFHNADFYDSLKSAASGGAGKIFKEYDSVSELMNDRDVIMKSDNKIIPDFYISAFKSDKRDNINEFISFFMSDEYQDDGRNTAGKKLPVEKDYYSDFAKSVRVQDDECEQLIDIIENTHLYTGCEKSIRDIITDNVREYIDSGMTEEQTAERIENSINLYLKERK